jgi:hypothetical protein
MTFIPNIEYDIKQAIDVIYSTYGDTVSVSEKKKNLLKFGSRTTVGTGWETLMTTQGSETAETLLSTNGITTVVSSSGSDTSTIKYEYHTIAGDSATFGVSTDVTLTGTTPVTLPTAAARVSRAYNSDGTALVGNIYFYEGGTRTDANTHAVIPAGEQQTQKAQTTISSTDYWIVTNITLSVLSKTSAYAEGRLEAKPIGTSYWRPISQNFSCKDSSGTVELSKKPYIIVPKNYDVRLVVKTNAASVSVAGGFNGYLAKVI